MCTFTCLDISKLAVSRTIKKIKSLDDKKDKYGGKKMYDLEENKGVIVWKNPSIFPHSINSMCIHSVMNLKKINLLVLVVGAIFLIASVMTAAADDPLDRPIVEGENDGGNNLIIAPCPDDLIDEVIVTSDPDFEDEPADDEMLLDQENLDENGDWLISPGPEDDQDASFLNDEQKGILGDETSSEGKSFEALGLPLYGGLAAMTLLLSALVITLKRL